MIGLPPLGGFISNGTFYLGALDRDMTWVVVVLLLSSLLNVFYLLPVAISAFFRSKENEGETEIKEAPMACGSISYNCPWLLCPFSSLIHLQLVGIIK